MREGFIKEGGYILGEMVTELRRLESDRERYVTNIQLRCFGEWMTRVSTRKGRGRRESREFLASGLISWREWGEELYVYFSWLF